MPAFKRLHRDGLRDGLVGPLVDLGDRALREGELRVFVRDLVVCFHLGKDIAECHARIVGAHFNGDRLALCVGKGDRRLVEAVLDQRLIAYERGPGLVPAASLLRNQGQVILE